MSDTETRPAEIYRLREWHWPDIPFSGDRDLDYEQVTLAGATELAWQLGVKPDTIHMWRIRHDDFPTPLARLKIGSVWALEDVEEWHRGRGVTQKTP